MLKEAPEKPVKEAVKQIKIEVAANYDEAENQNVSWEEVVAEMGIDTSIKIRLLCVWEKVIGKNPKSRNKFNPKQFIKRVIRKSSMIVMKRPPRIDNGEKSDLSDLANFVLG